MSAGLILLALAALELGIGSEGMCMLAVYCGAFNLLAYGASGRIQRSAHSGTRPRIPICQVVDKRLDFKQRRTRK